MRASILRQPRELDVLNIPIPEIEKDEVLVKVNCTGICGTDVSVYRGDYEAKENVILGHEFSGKVVRIGKEVSKVEVDDHIVSQASWGCNGCHWCHKGLASYCNSPKMMGRTINGTLAEYIVLPEHVIYKIDKNTSSVEAHSAVNIATCLRALDRSGLRLGDNVLIVGPGFSGLTILQLCKLAGARDIVMVGTRDSRLLIAEELGANLIVNINTDSDWEKNVLKRTKNIGFDVCIEASGSVSGLLSSIRMVRKGGNVVQFGTSFNMINNLPQKDFYSREISLIGSKGGNGFYQKAIGLLEKNKINIDPLITHKFTLDEVNSAFKVMMNKKLENVIRAVVYC